MILNCPSCSAKFMVSSEALGDHGRDVRCSKCGHIWFQPPDRDSLDDLSIGLDDHDYSKDASSDNDISFNPYVERPEAEPTPEILKSKTETPQKKKTVMVASLRQKKIAGVMVALAIASVVFYGIVAAYKPIGKAIPFMGAAYEKIGWPLPKIKSQIAFERLKLSREGNKIKGTGLIVNLTSEDQSLNHITVDLMDLSDKVVKSFDIKMTSATLKAESSEAVEFFVDEPPKDAVSVRIKLFQ
ncbi:MAG: hypothetical protein DI586_05740 [Micavibrio aeruginosavorus]|uniref:Zinc finger/thioredoxin putative domain-containing protein n=1 Tax=Micavibrio aeruginosavorus TaxID=349221 RepID=A0A2W5HJE8_9BACT|nr:MAG: hypothetical protein DI586_05740 [Micavibrio aeruginosavorus]